jgi:Fe-S cluster assembly protein SufD
MELNALAELARTRISKAPEALRAPRLAALGSFEQRGLTAPDPEFYKYTNLQSFIGPLTLSAHPLPTPEVGQVPGLTTIVFLDGVYQPGPSSIDGVEVGPLSEVPQWAEKRADAISPLHQGLLSGGVSIRIRRGKSAGPLRIMHLLSGSEVSAPVIVVEAEAQSSIGLLEEIRGAGTGNLFISETYVQVAPGAQVEHLLMAEGGAEALSHVSVFARVGRDGTFRSCMLNLGGKLHRRNLEVRLEESGAHGESHALYLAGAGEHSDVNTLIDHLSADTTSDQLAKGILDGDSKGIFTGRIFIRPEAQRVASGQLNRNLLLSKKAQAFSQPQLEIFADDVKCSHGSTTGQLSPEEFFYFKARGIPEDRARALLAQGFSLEVALKLKHKLLCEQATGAVKRQLKQKFNLDRP